MSDANPATCLIRLKRLLVGVGDGDGDGDEYAVADEPRGGEAARVEAEHQGH